MGLVLGLDGKQRAMDINIGNSVSTLSTLYVGLLQAAPANMDGMTLATLIHASNGNEFAINGNFYTGRQAISFTIASTDASGSAAQNDNPTPVEWTNTTGSIIEVYGMFITDAASGTSGKVIWVGTPDAGTATINNSAKASLYAGDIIIRID